MDDRITRYISDLPDWQQAVLNQIRALIHQAEPDIKETTKRGDRPYFVLKGNVCAFQATKDHLNIFIYDPIAPDPHDIINQGHDNATARSIQIYKDQPINPSAFKQLITAVADNNRVGGWRKLKA